MPASDINAALEQALSAFRQPQSTLATKLRGLLHVALLVCKKILFAFGSMLIAVLLLPLRVLCRIAFLVMVIVIAAPIVGDFVAEFVQAGIKGIHEIIALPNTEDTANIKWILPFLALLVIALASALVAVFGGVKGLFYMALGIVLLAGSVTYVWHVWPMAELIWGMASGAVCMLLLCMSWIGIKGFIASSKRQGKFLWAMLTGLSGVSGLVGLSVAGLGMMYVLAYATITREIYNHIALLFGFSFPYNVVYALFNLLESIGIPINEFNNLVAIVSGFFIGALAWGRLLEGWKRGRE